MKAKKNKKKLLLSKITITHLDKVIISKAKGGAEQKPTANFPPCEIVVIDTVVHIFDTYTDC